MAHEQQCARPLRQLRLEQLERLEIEVVGRLIEHQDIRRAGEQAREEQAVPLAARERLDGRPRALVGKQEIPQVAVHVTRLPVDRHRIVPVAHRVEHRALGVELLALLIVVGRLHVCAPPHLPLVRRQLSQQQPQQRRLAGAVGPDEANPIPTHDPHGDLVDDHAGAITLRHPARLEDELARLVRLFGPHPDGAHLLPAIRALLAQGQQRLDTPLVARPPRLDALPQPDFFLREPLVELVVLDGFVGEPFFLPPQERRVVARPGREPPAIELDDARRQALKERAVVRDEHDRPGVLREEALEPGDGLDVEMVGGLVEQQQVGLGHQRAREEDSAAPSSG